MHLRELECQRNSLSEAFKRDRLLPALAAQTELAEVNARLEDHNKTMQAALAARADPGA
jgi:hypothetical protein